MQLQLKKPKLVYKCNCHQAASAIPVRMRDRDHYFFMQFEKKKKNGSFFENLFLSQFKSAVYKGGM